MPLPSPLPRQTLRGLGDKALLAEAQPSAGALKAGGPEPRAGAQPGPSGKPGPARPRPPPMTRHFPGRPGRRSGGVAARGERPIPRRHRLRLLRACMTQRDRGTDRARPGPHRAEANQGGLGRAGHSAAAAGPRPRPAGGRPALTRIPRPWRWGGKGRGEAGGGGSSQRAAAAGGGPRAGWRQRWVGALRAD